MKARDLIPAWPRGRSTSRPLAAGSVWPWEYVFNLWTMDFIGVFPRVEWKGLDRKPLGPIVGGGDFCFKHNVSCLQKQCAECADNQAEERRKADMMECWYWIERSAARGPFYPEPIDQQIFKSYGLPLRSLAKERYGR